MIRWLCYIVSVFMLTQCNNNWSSTNELNINGKVEKVVDYHINVSYDKNEIVKDTITKEITSLNNLGKITNRKINQFFGDNEQIESKYIFNNRGFLETEITISKDFNLHSNYIYEDTLLQEISSKLELEKEIFISSWKYEYKNNRIVKDSLSTIIIDNNSNDTTFSLLKKNFYNNKKLITHYIEEKNTFGDISIKKYFNKYNNQNLISKIEVYDKQDSLLETNTFKFKYDSFNNWTTWYKYRNDSLVSEFYRTIFYVN